MLRYETINNHLHELGQVGKDKELPMDESKHFSAGYNKTENVGVRAKTASSVMAHRNFPCLETLIGTGNDVLHDFKKYFGNGRIQQMVRDAV